MLFSLYRKELLAPATRWISFEDITERSKLEKNRHVRVHLDAVLGVVEFRDRSRMVAAGGWWKRGGELFKAAGWQVGKATRGFLDRWL